MIRFPDINEDLMRVYEVVDSNGVEAGFEFIEEKEFDEEQKDLDEAENERSAEKKDAMPAHWKPVVGNDKKPGQQRKCLDDGDEQVPMKATQKGAKDVGCGQPGGFESKKENDAEYEPNNDQEKAPECGKAITRANPGHR